MSKAQVSEAMTCALPIFPSQSGRNPCAYGIDFPTKEELIANKYSHEELRKYLECDSIGYLSIEGMLKCVSSPKENYCTACWSGNYPVPFEQQNKYHAEKSCGNN